jgi:beta-N-acetylhexosaminidase
MISYLKTFFFALWCVCLALASLAVVDSDGWVEGKIQSMSLRDKIGQMFIVDVIGNRMTDRLRTFIEKGRYGGIILFDHNLVDEDQTQVFIKELQTHAIVNSGIPLLMSVDQEGGLVNRLGSVTNYKPMRHSARTIGRVFDYAPERASKIVDKVTGNIAKKMRHLGFNMNMAPVLDLTNDKNSYIYSRSYGSDPEKVTEISQKYINIMHAHGIVTTGKHFPNLGHTVVDSHVGLPVINKTLNELKRHEFKPFKSLSNRLGAIMVGHVMVPKVDPKYPASISTKLIGALRNDLKFDGVVITDDIKMGALSKRYTPHETVLRAVFAGADMIIMAWDVEKQLAAASAIEKAVRKGVISEGKINQSVRRILKLKYKFAKHGSEQ